MMVEMKLGETTVKVLPSKVEVMEFRGWEISYPVMAQAEPVILPAEPDLDEADEAQEED
jgi:hypothetical protein